MINIFNFRNTRNAKANITSGNNGNQSVKSGGGEGSSFLKKLLALLLFVIACAFLWSGIMMPYSRVFINILLVISGIFILLICSDLIDQINHFGKYNDDDDGHHCDRDHSDGIDEDYNSPNDYSDYGGNYQYGSYQDNNHYDYQINSCPNSDYPGYRQNSGYNPNSGNTPTQNENNYPNLAVEKHGPKKTSKPDDKDYSQLED